MTAIWIVLAVQALLVITYFAFAKRKARK